MSVLLKKEGYDYCDDKLKFIGELTIDNKMKNGLIVFNPSSQATETQVVFFQGDIKNFSDFLVTGTGTLCKSKDRLKSWYSLDGNIMKGFLAGEGKRLDSDGSVHVGQFCQDELTDGIIYKMDGSMLQIKEGADGEILTTLIPLDVENPFTGECMMCKRPEERSIYFNQLDEKVQKVQFLSFLGQAHSIRGIFVTGVGTMRFKNGLQWYDVVGPIKKGFLEGQGKRIDQDCKQYEGTFMRNILIQGKVILPSGEVQTGSFKDNLLDGLDCARYEISGLVSTGQFVGGAHTQGSQYYANGDRAIGKFKVGLYEGTYYSTSGLVRQGTFDDGLLNGPDCSQTLPDGVKMQGIFDNGVFNEGTKYLLNEDEWIGVFTNDIITKGEIHYKNGIIDKGTFDENALLNGINCERILKSGDKLFSKFIHGDIPQGARLYKCGDKAEGLFKNNELTSGSYTFLNGDIFKGTFAFHEGTVVLDGNQCRKEYFDGRLCVGNFSKGVCTDPICFTGFYSAANVPVRGVITFNPDTPDNKKQRFIMFDGQIEKIDGIYITGVGVMKRTIEGYQQVSTLEGNIFRGNLEGDGKCVDEDGFKSVGNHIKCIIQQGEVTLPTRIIQKGTFKNRLIEDDNGVEISPDGDVSTGKFEAGVFVEGVKDYKLSGAKAEGTFNEKGFAKGIYTLKDGEIWKGTFGVDEGKVWLSGSECTKILPTGKKIVGLFDMGYQRNDSYSFKGTYNPDRTPKNGVVTITYDNPLNSEHKFLSFEGEIEDIDDVFVTGTGTMLKNFVTEEGSYISTGHIVRGYLDGKGVRVNNNDGVIFEGIWEKGYILSGEIKCPDGRIDRGTFKNLKLDGEACERIMSDGEIDKGVFRENQIVQGTSERKGTIFKGTFDEKRQLQGDNCSIKSQVRTVSGRFLNGWLADGTITTKTLVCRGTFDENQNMHGNDCSIVCIADGSKAEGRFEHGYLVQGKISRNREVYEGTFAKLNVIQSIDEGCYRGGIQEKTFENMRLHGDKCSKILADGRKIVGEFFNGEAVKKCKTFPSGDKAEGIFGEQYILEGTYTYASGKVEIGQFEQEKGLLHGENCEMKLENGTRRIGQFVNGDLKRGKILYANGNTSEGFYQNFILINGLFKFSDGGFEQGFFHPQTGDLNGDNCTKVFVSGARYVGTFVNGIHVSGVQFYATGAKAEGIFGPTQIKQGLYTFKNGNWEQGTFDDKGQLHGPNCVRQGEKWRSTGYFEAGKIKSGECVSKTGQIERGSFDDEGEMHGSSCYIRYLSGDEFTGKMNHGTRSSGTYKFTSGNKYTGDFNSEGEYHDSHCEYYFDGYLYKGSMYNDGESGSGTYKGVAARWVNKTLKWTERSGDSGSGGLFGLFNIFN